MTALISSSTIHALIQKTGFSDAILFQHDTEQAQLLLLKQKLNFLKNTQFNKDLGSPANYHEEPHDIVDFYKTRFPITHYHQLHPYIERMMKGEGDVLFPGVIQSYAKSSGTSSGSQGLQYKYIPISSERICDQELCGTLKALGYYCEHYSDSCIFSYMRGYGHVVTLGGASREEEKDGFQYKASYISGLFADETPFWLNYRRYPSRQTAKLGGKIKYRAIREEIIGKKITTISGVCMLVKDFLGYLKQCATDPTQHWITEEQFENTFSAIELVLLGGGPMGNFRQEINGIIGRHLRYIQVHNASEGFFGAQNSEFESETHNRMQLLDTCYYEFIPKSVYFQYQGILENLPINIEPINIDQGVYQEISTTTYNCIDILTMLQNSILTDEEYVMIISTDTLTRFVIGDLVRFNTKQTDTILYQVTGRLGFSMNTYNEHVEQSHLQKLLEQLNTNASFITNCYMLSYLPENNFKVSYQVFLEHDGEVDKQDRTTRFDIALQTINEQYKVMRIDKDKFGPAQLSILKKGTILEAYKELDSLIPGSLIGPQFKIPLMKESNAIIMAQLQQTKAFQQGLMWSSLSA